MNIPEPFERANNFCFVPKTNDGTDTVEVYREAGCTWARDCERIWKRRNAAAGFKVRRPGSRGRRRWGTARDGGAGHNVRPASRARSPAPLRPPHQHREATRGPLLGLLVRVPQGGIEA